MSDFGFDDKKAANTLKKLAPEAADLVNGLQDGLSSLSSFFGSATTGSADDTASVEVNAYGATAESTDNTGHAATGTTTGTTGTRTTTSSTTAATPAALASLQKKVDAAKKAYRDADDADADNTDELETIYKQLKTEFEAMQIHEQDNDESQKAMALALLQFENYYIKAKQKYRKADDSPLDPKEPEKVPRLESRYKRLKAQHKAVSAAAASWKMFSLDTIPSTVLTLQEKRKPKSVIFSIDGKYVMSTSKEDSNMYVYDVLSGTRIRTIPLGGRSVVAGLGLAVTAHQPTHVVVGLIQSVGIYDFITGKQIRNIQPKDLNKKCNTCKSKMEIPQSSWLTKYYRSTTAVSISNDGKWIAASEQGQSTGGNIRLFNYKTGEFILMLHGGKDKNGQEIRGTGHFSEINAISFSSDGKYLVSGANDVTLCIWNIATKKVIMRSDDKYSGQGAGDIYWQLGERGFPLRHTWGVTAVAFHPNSNYVVSGSKDSTIRMWDVNTGITVRHFIGAFAENNGNDCGNIDTDYCKDSQLRPLAHRKSVTCLSFSSDGKRLVSGSEDMTVVVWDVATGNRLQTFHGHKSGILSVDFSEDGMKIVSGSEDNTVKVWG